MAEALDDLRGAYRVRTIRHRLALGALYRRIANRTARGQVIGGQVLVAARRDDRADDFWNHFTRAAHGDDIADAEILRVHVAFVVQRRHRDGDAADLGGFEHGIRVDAACPPDVHFDREQSSRHFLGRILERDRPAGFAADRAELALLLERVHFDDDAVRAIVERRALGFPRTAELGHLLKLLEASRF